ncbi:unnamed protein product, partial [Didymodactylos carnosus]
MAFKVGTLAIVGKSGSPPLEIQTYEAKTAFHESP